MLVLTIVSFIANYIVTKAVTEYFAGNGILVFIKCHFLQCSYWRYTPKY